MLRLPLLLLLCLHERLCLVSAQDGSSGITLTNRTGINGEDILMYFDISTLDLFCCFHSTIPSHFTWYACTGYRKECSLIPDGNEFEQEVKKLNETTSCMYLKKSPYKITDQEYYLCNAESNDDSQNSTIYVSGLSYYTYLPANVIPVQDTVSVMEGENATLACIVQNFGSAYDVDAYWILPSGYHLKSKQTELYRDYNVSMHVTILNVTQSDAGKYVCKVRKISLITDFESAVYLDVRSNEPEDIRTQSPTDVTDGAVSSQSTLLIPMLVVSALVLVTSLIAVVAVHRVKKRAGGIYNLLGWSKNDDVITYRYDVFLSYSVESEEDFVTQYLFPSLELEPFKFKVCYHHRDFTPGECINNAIADAILNSRKVLVLLSPQYLNSGYCIYELQQAMYKEYATGRNVVAVIKLGSVDDIPLCLRSKSYIDFSNNDERKNLQKKLLNFLKD